MKVGRILWTSTRDCVLGSHFFFFKAKLEEVKKKELFHSGGEGKGKYK